VPNLLQRVLGRTNAGTHCKSDSFTVRIPNSQPERVTHEQSYARTNKRANSAANAQPNQHVRKRWNRRPSGLLHRRK